MITKYSLKFAAVILNIIYLIKHISIMEDYSEVRKELDRILEMIKKGDYTTDYEEPNFIRKCTAPDGRTFYMVENLDDAKSSNTFGSFTVYVGDYYFTCNYEDGEFESDFFDELDEDGYELDDEEWISKEELMEEVTDALYSRDDVYIGERTETDDVMRVFAKCNKIENPEYYWCDNCDSPSDIDSEFFYPPQDENCGEVSYDGETYYLVEEPTGDEEEPIHAVNSNTVPEDNGTYETVLLYLSEDDEGNIEVTDCEESEDLYNAFDQDLE